MRWAIVVTLLLVSSAAHAEEEPKATPWKELALSTGASAVLAPAIYSTASLVGRSTANLDTSASPALLIVALVPGAVAAGALAWERRREGAKTKFLVPYLCATAAQIAVLFVSTYAKTWVSDSKDLLLLSGATGMATGGAATLGASF